MMGVDYTRVRSLGDMIFTMLVCGVSKNHTNVHI